MRNNKHDSDLDGRSSTSVRQKHQSFERAWIAAGCPRYFKWSSQVGRIWDVKARKEHLEFLSLAPEARRKIIDLRRKEFENFQRRGRLEKR